MASFKNVSVNRGPAGIMSGAKRSALPRGRAGHLSGGDGHRVFQSPCQHSPTPPQTPGSRQGYSLRGSPGWPLIEGPGVEGSHGAGRAWAPGAWSHWAEGTLEERESDKSVEGEKEPGPGSQSPSPAHLDLLLDELLGVVDLLGRAPDDEQFEVGVPVGWQLPGDLYKGARLLVYGFHVLATCGSHRP